jgi:hypothetical protein
MRQPKTNIVLQAIEKIFITSKLEGFNPSLTKKVKSELQTVSNYLGTTQNEAFFFSLIITENFSGCSPDLSDLCKHLNTNAIKLVAHMESFDRLMQRGFMFSKGMGRRHNDLVSNRCYTINQEIILAIMRNTQMPLIELKKKDTALELFGSLYQLIESRVEGELNFMEFRMKFVDEMKEMEKFPAINNVLSNNLTPIDRSILIWVIWKSIIGGKRVDIENLARSLFPSPSGMVTYLQSLKSGSSALIKDKLLECHEARFLNDIEVTLTKKMSDILATEGIIIKMELSKREGLIYPDKIVEKNLFYNESEALQMDAVRSMLEEDRYFELIQRLKQKSLPMSTNILLYGAPGTGKTESVYQIARATGREIMKVEISQMKSMWFGESEKIIKKVFTDYTEYCSHTSRTPILLFNEADAILGTRNSFGGGNTRQTENAIQNILLEELENFKGIFIATTNLVQNLDKAFERRFLFKVEFNKPSVESRQRIWMDRILTLTENDALELANKFDLSGGQIENIVRKCEIEFILKGQEASLQNIMRFCSEENLSGVRTSNRIGF